MILALLRSFGTLDNHLKAVLITLCVLLIFASLYLCEVSNKPTPFEQEPSITEGTLVWVSGNQKGLSFVIRDDSNGRLTRLLARPSYTKVPNDFFTSQGHHISVTHFGRFVTACTLESGESCMAKCNDAYECEVKRINVSAEELKLLCISLSISILAILFHYFLWHKITRYLNAQDVDD